MPINDGSGVTPGEICYSCALYHTQECPYGNHLKQSSLQFDAGINGVCMYYSVIQENYDSVTVGSQNKMKKQAKDMTDAELKVSLYRSIRALKEEEQKHLFVYWNYLFPEKYAKEMVTDVNESVQKQSDSAGKPESQKSKKDRKNDMRQQKFFD